MDGVWNEWERAAVEQRLGAAIVGGPDTVKRKLEALVAETEADEVMIVSDFFDIRDRLRSFEIVASLKNGAGLSTRTPEPERPGPRPTGRLTIAMPAFPALY